MNTLQTNGKNALQAVKVAESVLDNATNAREIAITNLKKLSTRVVNALEATDATKQAVDDAKTINRKIQGNRADNKKTTSTETTQGEPVPGAEILIEQEQKNISVSQQSYDSLIDNFSKLIVSVSAEPLYTPNETDLKVTALNTLLTNLKTTNTAVINVTPAYHSAIIIRNTTLYQTDTGLVDTALEVKKYVKSVFGANSQQYGEISGLEFKKLKKL